ncbi:short chain dehydrogenase [Leuconostoc carnosum JB16]|uniref:Short chain dehydrogenase n=1 Tax=Leuconostoc carnosum (strain JB16) TaxID=1229758 RepID=K0DBT7_LEUCJ|nr:oxidoreductase [Leuconostoc carnosum]AFT81022.1 short chain dehydrogenase [Leuconostoc carnosum JB16]
MTTKKVVLLTGASSGIGYQTAVLLASLDYKVYGAARRVEKMAPLAALGITPIKLDVTDEESSKQAIQEIINQEGRIDVLINNAGYGSYGAIENVALDEAKHQFDTNLFGVARLVQLVMPYMREQHAGKIINISSMAGRVTTYMGAWYHATKYALEAFSDALCMEVKPFGVDVVLVEPGGIKTEWGIIAADHLKQSSQGTVYSEHALAAADRMHKLYNSDKLTDPSVIAGTIVKAVESSRPRARYLVGYGAKFSVFLHTILPAKFFDKLVQKLI